MASFVRESKLRQSAVTVSKRDQHYESLKTYQLQNDVNGVAGNASFLAYADTTGTGSAIAVLPHSSTGKNHVPVSSPAYAQPLIRAHGQAVQDFEFNPFNQQQLYSCSTDKTVKLWQIPEEGMIVDISSAVTTMALADQAAVRGLASHPTVNGIVAGRGSRSLSLLDFNSNKVLTSSGAKSASVPTADFASLAWSFHGDLLMTTAKDKQLRLFDPRLLGSEGEAVASAAAHVGLRFSRCIWLGDSPYILTCGHNNAQEREFMLWDSRNLSGACLKRERVDSSYGPLIPLYDADLNALVLMGKGDNSLRLYDVEVLKTGDGATVHAISNSNVTAGGADVTKGACLLPKQANDLMACEVMRILKVSDNIVQPISITVPRKERMKFHEDLYPPTVCGASASMTAEEYLAGENRPLTRIALVPKAVGAAVSFGTSPCPSPVPGELESSTGTAAARSESPAPSETARALSKRFSSLTSGSKFRHMYGTENTRDNTFFNLAPDLSSSDSPIVACNETCFAIPHRGGGGPVYVGLLNSYGKVAPDCAVVNGHKSAVQEVAFSPFHPGLMATGSNDATVKIWDVDSCFRQERSAHAAALSSLEPCAALTTHTNSIRTVNFHPTVSGLLSSTSQDMTLRYFDVEQGSEVSCMQIPEAVTVNVSYNYDGTLLALAGKDRMVRIVDPRARSVVMSTETGLASNAGARTSVTNHPHLGRNLRVAWCCTRTGANADPLLTVSSGNSGLRQMHVWDPRAMQTPLITKSIDSASGQLFPLFDETMNTIFLVGKGDTILRTYEMLFLEENVPGAMPSLLEKSTDFQSSIDPVAGICMLPKRTCDVRNVEVARLLKLTTDALIPISFKVPRADHLKAYFHDDLYAPVRAPRSLATAPEWASEDTDVCIFQPVLETLQPEGMAPISTSTPDPTPSSTKSKVDSFKLAQQKAEEESKLRESNFSRLQQMAVQNAQYNRNVSGGTASAALQAANTAASAASVGGSTKSGAAAAVEEEVDSDDNWDDDN